MGQVETVGSMIKIYNSMAEFYAAMGGKLEQDVDFTIHPLEKVHGEVPVKSPIFRANYYSVVLIRQGQGCYILDENRYATQARTIYFTNPVHVKGFEIDQPSFGYVITFSEAFLKQHVHADIFDEFPFLIAEVAPPNYPEAEVFAPFDELGHQLLQEFESPSPYKFKVIGSLLVVLLLKVKEHFWKAYNPLTETDSASGIALTFKRNLEQHFRELLAGQCDRPYKVKDYAEAQFLNASYFSTVVKRKTGKSVKQWVAEKTAAEAQVLLARSSLSVQEIALRLGFPDAAHFSRLFKSQTRLSPSALRQQA